MTNSTSNHGLDFRDYPFLTKEEFSEACHHLDRRYRQATLGPIRRRWKLNTCTALDSSFSLDAEYATYIQIIRPLEGDPDLDGLSGVLGSFAFGDETGEGMAPRDQEMMEVEEADDAVLLKQQQPDIGYVTYEIHLHPTYRAPCLWFSLHGLPFDEPAFSIDTVLRRLVPDQFKDLLRAAGGIGGISTDHHPITSIPSFFVHPCLLGDVMRDFDCSKENYLMVWLGLVGGSVGLWVPNEMALDSL